jgi:transposase
VLDEGGIDALRAMGDKGRPPQLDKRQFELLRRSLLDRPTEHGFGTELWTLKRIRLLIKRMFGVSYSEVHVWRILGALGFSNQKPERRAIERDDAAVEQFKRKTLPALKKKPKGKAA